MRIVDTQFDVIIIGSGGAGLKAALSSVDKGAKTLVLTKGEPQRSGGTLSAHYSFCAVPPNSNVNDSPAQFAADIIKSSEQISDPILVEKLATEAYEAIQYAEQLGVKFDREKDSQDYDLGWLAGHKYARAFHVGNVVGRDLVRVLLKKLQKSDHISIKGFTQALMLHIEDGQYRGVYAYDYEADEVCYYSSKSIVIATGGGSQVYELNTNPLEATGDGYSLALEAGAELVDMEFVQFYPTVLVAPKGTRGLMFNSGIVIPQGARLINAHGHDFWDDYKVGELKHATRDTMSRIIATELAKGNGTANGGIYIDATNVANEAIPQLQQKLLVDLGVGTDEKKYEVAPGAHYFMGGIKIDTDAATTIKGMFAAGECTGGLHGANRLAGNALSENQVFGKTAGESAADYAFKEAEKKAAATDHDLFLQQFSFMFPTQLAHNSNANAEFTTVPQLIKALQKTMQQYVGVNRTEQELTLALKEIENIELQQRAISFGEHQVAFNRKKIKAIDLYHMIHTAKAIIYSALSRKESRGAHQRLDFPQKHDDFNASICVKQKQRQLVTHLIRR